MDVAACFSSRAFVAYVCANQPNLKPRPIQPNTQHVVPPSKHIAAEAFWGVRVAVGEALSDAPSNASAAILVRWI